MNFLNHLASENFFGNQKKFVKKNSKSKTESQYGFPHRSRQ